MLLKCLVLKFEWNRRKIVMKIMKCISYKQKNTIVTGFCQSFVLFTTWKFVELHHVLAEKQQSSFLNFAGRLFCKLASLVQWQNARLPRGRPGFDSRTMQSLFCFLRVYKEQFMTFLFHGSVSIIFINKWLLHEHQSLCLFHLVSSITHFLSVVAGNRINVYFV